MLIRPWLQPVLVLPSTARAVTLSHGSRCIALLHQEPGTLAAGVDLGPFQLGPCFCTGRQQGGDFSLFLSLSLSPSLCFSSPPVWCDTSPAQPLGSP